MCLQSLKKNLISQPTATVTPNQPAIPSEEQSSQQPVPSGQPESSTEVNLRRRSSRIAAKPTISYEGTQSTEQLSTKPNETSAKKPAKKTATKSTKGRRVKYILKDTFSWDRCFQLGQKYKLAVYQH